MTTLTKRWRVWWWREQGMRSCRNWNYSKFSLESFTSEVHTWQLNIYLNLYLLWIYICLQHHLFCGKPVAFFSQWHSTSLNSSLHCPCWPQEIAGQAKDAHANLASCISFWYLSYAAIKIPPTFRQLLLLVWEVSGQAKEAYGNKATNRSLSYLFKGPIIFSYGLLVNHSEPMSFRLAAYIVVY